VRYYKLYNNVRKEHEVQNHKIENNLISFTFNNYSVNGSIHFKDISKYTNILCASINYSIQVFSVLNIIGLN